MRCEFCLLRKYNPLNALNQDELSRVSRIKKYKCFKKGEILFQEGKTLNGIYCINDGVIKLAKYGSNGKIHIIKLLIKGDFLGHRSLFSKDSSNLSATAITDVKACFIPKDEINTDILNNSKFAKEFLHLMADEVKKSENKVVDFIHNSNIKRLVKMLLFIYENFGIDKNNMLKLVLSRKDYANLTGTATESLIRNLSKLDKKKYISLHGKKIKILKLEELEKISL